MAMTKPRELNEATIGDYLTDTVEDRQLLGDARGLPGVEAETSAAFEAAIAETEANDNALREALGALNSAIRKHYEEKARIALEEKRTAFSNEAEKPLERLNKSSTRVREADDMRIRAEARTKVVHMSKWKRLRELGAVREDPCVDAVVKMLKKDRSAKQSAKSQTKGAGKQAAPDARASPKGRRSPRA